MPGWFRRQDVIALGALTVAGVGVPLWLAAAAGAIGLPNGDDWVYKQGADSLFRTGSIDMPGHTAAAIGQVLMAQPFLALSGGDPWAFTAFGSVMACIGIVSSYLLARRFTGTGTAVLVVLLVVAIPGFAREPTGFNTDGPAFALEMLCLLLGVAWLQGSGKRLTLAVALGVGLLAVSIREFALAAPATILVVAWARNRKDERTFLAAMSTLFVAGVVAVLLAAASIPGRGTPASPNLAQLLVLGAAFTTFAAFLLPATALAMGRRLAGFRPELIVLSAGLVGLVLVVPFGSFVGLDWLSNGSGGNAVLNGDRAPVIGGLVWTLSEQLAAFAAILLAALGFRWAQRILTQVDTPAAAGKRILELVRSDVGPLLVFLAAYGAELVVYAPLGGSFDRYLHPMIPAATILLLRGPATKPAKLGASDAFSQAAVAWLALSAFALAANSLAFDVATHRAGEAAVAMGYDARTVDAGYVWVVSHAAGVEVSGSSSYGLAWYDDQLMPSRPCAVVSNSPLLIGDLRLIQVDPSAYRQYLFFGPAEPLYLYGSLAAGCPVPPSASRAPTSSGDGLGSVSPGGYTSAIIRNGLAAHGGGF